MGAEKGGVGDRRIGPVTLDFARPARPGSAAIFAGEAGPFDRSRRRRRNRPGNAQAKGPRGQMDAGKQPAMGSPTEQGTPRASRNLSGLKDSGGVSTAERSAGRRCRPGVRMSTEAVPASRTPLYAAPQGRRRAHGPVRRLRDAGAVPTGCWRSTSGPASTRACSTSRTWARPSALSAERRPEADHALSQPCSSRCLRRLSRA